MRKSDTGKESGMGQNRVFDDQLTRKWRSRINGLCNLLGMPAEDGIREMQLYEWELQRRFKDLKERERYFCKTINFRLQRELRQDGWWYKHVETFPDLNVVESSVTMRSFDSVGYDRLVQHICYMLSMTSDVAMEMFLIRVTLQMRWDKMKVKHYADLSHREFYGYVKDIKRTASESAMLFKEQPWIVSLLR